MINIPKVNSILYVEDEKYIKEELAEVLENFCNNLYLADDGFQGLKEFDKHRPDIIISDIKMPVMDGVEMCKAIKEINKDAHIIFTTAFSDIEFFQEAIELQVDGYILKPINLDALEKKILSIIEGIHLKDELYKKEQMLLQTSKLATMGEMIGNIAHQWRQPLSIISVGISTLKIDSELGEISNEEIIKKSDLVLDQVQYLSKTIDNFRSFFKPHDVNEKYNLKQFIDKCIDLVKASFDVNTIQTIKEIDSKINSYGDPNQLTQAIINILNNAKDALKDVENLRKKLIFIVTATEDENNNLVITIKDNAGGIPDNIIDRIFEPYFTTKHADVGTGLGLYITHSIIENNLNGTIFAENEIFEYEGYTYKGAKFTITLPLA